MATDSHASVRKTITEAYRKGDTVLYADNLSATWSCESPFLSVVRLKNEYPRANSNFGPDSDFAGHVRGADFNNPDGWNMYHGDVVPGFPKHPHRGIETITLGRRGWIDYADSLSCMSRVGHGDVLWMVAGRGINHSEMFPLFGKDENEFDCFQFLLNLPQEHKMVEPDVKVLWSEAIPNISKNSNINVALIAGSLDGHQAPRAPRDSYLSVAESDALIVMIRLPFKATWTLPLWKGPRAVGTLNRNIYFYSGRGATIAGKEFNKHKRIKVRVDKECPIVASGGAIELLVLQAREIDEEIVHHGPFVMTSKAEIRQAFADYQRTAFGGWPWPTNGMVHHRKQIRCVKYSDGSIDEPPEPAVTLSCNVP